jgi:GTP cyclohydrolase I
MTNEIEDKIRELMDLLEKEYNWKFNSEEKKNTPKRVKNMLDEWKEAHEYNHMTEFDNYYKYGNMVILKDIDFQAFCSHHLLPFIGKVTVGYIPGDVVLGASKLGRIVRKYSYKPQVQEKMTEEIADEIMKTSKAKGVMVVVKAKHLCMIMRGLNDPNIEMVTSSIRGVFEKPEVRNEFLNLIK